METAHAIDLEQRRSIPLELTRSASSSGELELSFSSETPCDRYYYTEILSHAPGAADLSRADNGGCPLLLNHDENKLIGVVDRAWIDSIAKRGKAKVRFAPNEAGLEAQKLTEQGFLNNVSVRYRIRKHKEEFDSETSTTTITATKWELIEISLVSCPEDPTVGVGRSVQNTPKRGKKMDTAFDEAQEQTNQNLSGVTAERNRIKVIQAMGQRYAARLPGGASRAAKLVEHAIDNGLPEQAARGLFADEILSKGEEPQSISRPMPQWDIPRSEQRQYSLVDLIRSQIEPGYQGGGYEMEHHQELMQRGYKPQNSGLLVPLSQIGPADRQRTFLAGSGGAAAPLVGEELMSGNFIDALRSRAFTLALGTTVLEGLQGNANFPRRSAVSDASWVSENADLPSSEGSFDSIRMTPKTIGVWANFSKLSLVQSTPNLESILRSDFADALARGIDRAIIAGSGTGAEPAGILNTPGVGSVPLGTNGGPITFDAILDLEQRLADSNALQGSLGYLTSAKLARKLKGIVEFPTAGSQAIWQNDPNALIPGMGRVNGYAAAMSTNVPSNLTKGSGTGLSAAIFGNWKDILLGIWGVMEIVVNPYGAGFRKGEIEIRGLMFADIDFRHAKSLAVITDATTT